MRTISILTCLAASLICVSVRSQDVSDTKRDTTDDPFRQLDETLPTPSESRLASGAPGPKYWQQKVDYDISVILDDTHQRLSGAETITYHNNSPHQLDFLWVQLDQNRFRKTSGDLMSRPAPSFEQLPFSQLQSHLYHEAFDGGFKIKTVTDVNGQPIPFTIVDTMMRLDIPVPLKSAQSMGLKITWEFNIVDAKKADSRGGYEFFEKEGNYIYEVAQWYPRLASYTDYAGWQHKQFLGAGEFTLEFGDFAVAINVPSDHVVAATGELQNPEEVLTKNQIERLQEIRNSGQIGLVITPEEAKANETREKASGTKTWKFSARNVRDFAWASSRKFIWDAKAHPNGNKKVWAMSYYPNEANPLWGKYSTYAVAHTLDVYTKFTFEFPYPVAISVNGPVFGMEYPMICFNGPRPEVDGTYSQGTKSDLISVVIHEVGHNYFPMIVNSDERQWTWMDEGLNSFLQFQAERQWQEKFVDEWGDVKPQGMRDLMSSFDKVPIMTNSDSIPSHQFFPNAYQKPVIALNVLRETVLGRELFDFAFKKYANRWKSKRPEPSDFFRTMEDASGVDLDWFWRGWFYTTKHVDIGIQSLRVYDIDTHDPDIEKALQRQKRDEIDQRDLIAERNRDIQKLNDRYPQLKDFYDQHDSLDVTVKERGEYQKFLEGLDEDEKKLLALGQKFYVIDLENIGGLVSPVILKVTFANQESELIHLPVEIWRQDPNRISRLILSKNEIVKIELDPRLQTADVERKNNYWPQQPIESRFKLFKEEKKKNPMQESREGK